MKTNFEWAWILDNGFGEILSVKHCEEIEMRPFPTGLWKLAVVKIVKDKVVSRAYVNTREYRLPVHFEDGTNVPGRFSGELRHGLNITPREYGKRAYIAGEMRVVSADIVFMCTCTYGNIGEGDFTKRAKEWYAGWDGEMIREINEEIEATRNARKPYLGSPNQRMDEEW